MSGGKGRNNDTVDVVDICYIDTSSGQQRISKGVEEGAEMLVPE